MNPEPGAASDTIEAPSYVVGRDAGGHWLAIETHGRGGGIFADADAALHYAETETARRPGAVQVATAPVCLGIV